MLTPTEHRPFIARIVARVAAILGFAGLVAALVTFLYLLLVGPGSHAAGAVPVFSAGSFLLAIVGVPCGMYSLWLSRTRLGYLALVMCVLPIVISVTLSIISGGAHR